MEIWKDRKTGYLVGKTDWKKPILGLIDTRSPVKNFKKQHLQKVDGRNCRTKERDDGILYVDSTEKKQFTGYTTVNVKAGLKAIRNAKTFVVQKRLKTFSGRDWMPALQLTITPWKQGSGRVICNVGTEKSNFNEEFSWLPFERRGMVKTYSAEGSCGIDYKPTQHKGRRIPYQLQRSVEEESNNLMNESHKEGSSDIKDNVSILPLLEQRKKTKHWK